MKVEQTPLKDVYIFTPRVFSDERGYFFETYQSSRYTEFLPHFVQDNVSRSRYGVIRGLHYQLPNSQGKLVGTTLGRVWDVIVDIRISSPTFGKTFSIILSDENHKQLYVPPGFAHGFCVLSDYADFYYKCTDFYAPEAEKGIAWNDPYLNIQWPVTSATVSEKDALLPNWNNIPHEHFFP